uniref:Protein kinase domain-containing protein n=1 Tax=Caenorhabditis japonica TaxID=281687 RepID=A0A8R1I1I9_CAEJA
MTAAIIRDISKALLQLHTNQVIHGAATAKNIYFMKENSTFCLLTSRANARKINSERIMESRAEDIAHLGQVLYRCLTGHEAGDEVNLTECPFAISEQGVLLASKMMARKFSESAHYIINHPFVVEKSKLRTARFMKLTRFQ